MWRLERFIALKYLGSGRERLVSLITYLSILGIALGVAALIVALSIMNGFERDLKNALIGANSHLTLSHFTGAPGVFSDASLAALGISEVKSYSPFIFRQALLIGSDKPSGALVRGIDLAKELNNQELVSSFRSKFKPLPGEEYKAGVQVLKDLGKTHSIEVPPSRSPFIIGSKPRREDLDGIVLGSALAKNLNAGPGQVIELVSPEMRISPFGGLPRYKKLKIVGLYQSGLSGYDEILAYISLPVAQKIFNMPGQYTGVGITIQDPYDAEAVKQKLEENFSFPYSLRTWIDDNHNLFQVITLEKYSLGIILALIILVAAFNIISSLIMLVYEKKRDIALLKSLGLKDSAIQRIFLLQGCALGLVGTVIGLGLGSLICFALARFEIISIPAGVYVKNQIPIEFEPGQVLLIALVSLGISLCVTYFPAKRASYIDPATSLRYE